MFTVTAWRGWCVMAWREQELPPFTLLSGMNQKTCFWQRWARVAFMVAMLDVSLITIPGVAHAAPADYDASFGGGVSRWFLSLNGQLSQAQAIVSQPDGKVLFAGGCRGISVQKTAFCVMRLHGNGQADTSFGSTGLTVTHVTPGFGSDIPQAMLLQPDGKVVVAGTCNSDTGGYDFCVVRYLANGTLDTAFGNAGRVLTALSAGTGSDLAHAVALDPAGNIVVAGQCGAPSNSCLASYDAVTGAPRPTFGTGGIQVFRMSGDPAAQESINALATDRFGRLHTAGSCHPNLDTALDFCVARLGAAGALDTNFGPGTGWVSTSFAADKLDDAANALLVQPDGKLLAAGSCRISPNVYGLCLARYLGNGSPDTTFDAAFAASGKVVTAPATHPVSAIRSLVLQPDGRIVAAGICQKVTPAADADICVARYLPEGQTDASFGSNGVAIIYPTSPSATLQEAAFALAMQPGGRLLVAAACGNTGTLSADACVIALAGGPLGYRRCSLDLDGDGVARADTDALLFTRLMFGVSSNAAVQGINFPPAAVRNSAALIRRHAIEQCGFGVAP